MSPSEDWAEGSHLEPCLQWGRKYLEANETRVGMKALAQRPMRFMRRAPVIQDLLTRFNNLQTVPERGPRDCSSSKLSQLLLLEWPTHAAVKFRSLPNLWQQTWAAGRHDKDAMA